MEAECIDCGKKPGRETWDRFDYISGDFYCENCSPNSDTWCRLCERENLETEEHHLVPRAKGGGGGETVKICATCHNKIHTAFTHEELAKKFNSIEELKQAGRIQPYFRWIRNNPEKRDVTFKEADSVRKWRRTK